MNQQESKTGSGRAKPRVSWTWLGILIPIAAIVALVVVGSGNNGPDTPTPIAAGTQAAMFELPTTAGTTVALEDALADGDVLLYFSMGVGCDGCFAQIPEVEGQLAARSIGFLPVMVQPADVVGATAAQWNIDIPILIDEDRAVSKAYDMLGKNGHTDRPFHSIAIVHQDGTLAFAKTYDTMFVGADEMMVDVDSIS